MRKYLLPIIGVLLIGLSCEKKEQEVPVSSVSMSQATAEMIIGETVQLKATVLPNNATLQTVTWASSKQSVATVSENGKVSAIAEGQSTITASAGGKSASCLISVSRAIIKVSSVSLNKSYLRLAIGQEEQLAADVFPDDADDKSLTWSSSNSAIATIGIDGKVQAIGEGNTVITASAGDAKATCNVEVYDPLPKAIDLGLSVQWASFNLGATKPEEFGWQFAWGEVDTKEVFEWNTYKWGAEYNALTKYVTDNTYGIQDNKGVLDLEDDAANHHFGGDWRMPTKEEYEELYKNCDINWGKSNGVDGTFIISRINNNRIFLPAPMVYSEYGNAPVGTYWSSSGSNSGAVFFRSGLMLMSKQYYNDISSQYRYYGYLIRPVYSPYIQVTSINLSHSNIEMKEGTQETIIATIEPFNATNKEVVWSSSNSAVASVKDGVVKAIKEGEATITAKAENNTASCRVVVKKTSKLDFFSMKTGSATNITPLSATITCGFSCDKDMTGETWSTLICLSDDSYPFASDRVFRLGTETGQFSRTFEDLQPGKTYYYRAAVYYQGDYYYDNVQSFSTLPLKTSGYVDLGLSVKWSACNLGTETPEETGYYYAWGETETKPKKDFTLAGYKFYDSEGEVMTDLGTDISSTKYDAAYVALGGEGRMPTAEEIQQLLRNCTWRRNCLYNGVRGYLVRGSNNEYIFIPATQGTSWDYIGYDLFWSSTLDRSNNNYAQYLKDYEGLRNIQVSTYNRCFGLPIRPVKM